MFMGKLKCSVALTSLFMGMWCFAAETDPSVFSKFQGSGLEGDPYLITSIADVDELKDIVEQDGPSTAGVYFKLTTDLDMSTHGAWPGIGVYSAFGTDTCFQGVFDGDNHLIKGLYFTRKSYGGFFNQVSGAVIKNLRIEFGGDQGFEALEVDDGRGYGAAAFVGHAINSKLINLTSSGSLKGTHNVAGIIVRVAGGNEIVACTNLATISGSYTKVGGIAVISMFSDLDGGAGSQFTGCANRGDILAEGSASAAVDGIGGMIAYAALPTSFSGCVNEGSIRKGALSDMYYDRVGGLVGVVIDSGGGFYVGSSEFKGENIVRADQKAVGEMSGVTIGGLFATVDGGKATLVSENSLEAGVAYRVMAPFDSPWRPIVVLRSAGTFVFDCSVVTASVDKIEVDTAPGCEVSETKIAGNMIEILVKERICVQWYVDVGHGSDTADGKTERTAFATLDKAIALAKSGDAIILCDGVYPPFTVNNRFITIESANGPDRVFVDGGKTMRCATLGQLGQTNTIVRGVTFQNGYLKNGTGAGTFGGTIVECVYRGNTAYGGGGAAGGVLCRCLLTGNVGMYGGGSYSADLIECTIQNNVATNGAGAYEGTLTGCRLTQNVALSYGGGMCLSKAKECRIDSNSAVWGGGTCDGRAEACMVSNNIAATYGGGVYFTAVNRSVICKNTAGSGAGIYDAAVANSVINGNAARTYGGGALYGTLVNCTVCFNDAGNTGAGADSATVVNSIVCWNTAGKSSQQVDESEVFSSFCDMDGRTDPVFVDAQHGDFHLREDSPCIDAGDARKASGDCDFDGNRRVVGKSVDLGAFESQVVKGDGEDEDESSRSWGGWSVLNDTEFAIPEALSDWDALARFSWRARDKFFTSTDLGILPPTSEPLIISLGSFSFGGEVLAAADVEVPVWEEFGVPVWYVRVCDDPDTGKLVMTVGGIEVKNVEVPSYDVKLWVEAVYGKPPTWLTPEQLAEWYAQRSRARIELFLTLVPASQYAEYVKNRADDEGILKDEDRSKLLIRGFAANASEDYLHLLSVRTPVDAVVNIFGTSALASTNWDFNGVGAFAKGSSVIGMTVAADSYFFKLISGGVDSDGDGISDVLETMKYGTNPNKADTSGGGIKDGEKIYRYGLNPKVRDTDSDGLDDDEEIIAGGNPIVPAAEPKREAAKLSIRYYYDDDDRLTGTYVGLGGASTTTKLSPAGNPKEIRERDAAK